ncbi:MAG: hypothetical protein CVU56_07680 [Deltaproteobacteria bacterium HGW-Deltaproteobacteria-14]|nr:MAG: hypothetical protein CVU56_07680 [Deltaproteobacteria bacterium HGW-Deltaproteobacteria-14]
MSVYGERAEEISRAAAGGDREATQTAVDGAVSALPSDAAALGVGDLEGLGSLRDVCQEVSLTPAAMERCARIGRLLRDGLGRLRPEDNDARWRAGRIQLALEIGAHDAAGAEAAARALVELAPRADRAVSDALALIENAAATLAASNDTAAAGALRGVAAELAAEAGDPERARRLQARPAE